MIITKETDYALRILRVTIGILLSIIKSVIINAAHHSFSI